MAQQHNCTSILLTVRLERGQEVKRRHGETTGTHRGVLPEERRVEEASDVGQSAATCDSWPRNRPRRLRHLSCRRASLQQAVCTLSSPLLCAFRLSLSLIPIHSSQFEVHVGNRNPSGAFCWLVFHIS